MNRPSFLDQKPPPNYVAGIGRGATGFSARGEKKIPRRLRNDQLEGQRGKVESDEEDREADSVFAAIEERLSGRKKQYARGDGNGSKTNDMDLKFSDLKRNLATVKEDQWLNLPEAGDFTRKNKRLREEEQLNRKTYAAPDSLISGKLDLAKISQQREKLLERHIDASVMNVNSSENADETLKYLDQLSARDGTQVEEEDVKKMRTILNSYRKSDPRKPQGWIASARLEKNAGNFELAKELVSKGSELCPRSEDIWLECIAMNETDIHMAKILVARGLRFVPSSLKLWLKACELENDKMDKKRVIRKAIREMPTESKLWKLIVDAESDKDEQLKILQKAVEFITSDYDLWSKLIELQDYDNAKKSLIKMKLHTKETLQTAIIAAKIELESENIIDLDKIVDIIQKNLATAINSLKVSDYLQNANILQSSEKSSILVEALTVMGLKAFHNENPSLAESVNLINKMENTIVKVYAYQYLLHLYPDKSLLWQSLKATTEMIKQPSMYYETFEKLLFTRKDGATYIASHPILTLMYSKETWKTLNNVNKAKEIIEKSIAIVPTSVELYLAKIKLLCQTSQFKEAAETFKYIFAKFDDNAEMNLEKVYIKYINFLKYQGHHDEAKSLIETKLLSRYGQNHKLYLQWGQIYHHEKNFQKASDCYNKGIKACKNNISIWLALASLEEIDLKQPIKARSLLDLALLESPKDSQLYLAKIKLEERAGNEKQMKLMIKKGLEATNNDPDLWVESLHLLSKKKSSVKKVAFQDAMNSTKNNYKVILEIATSFYNDAQYETAKKWIDRAIKMNPKYGDSWIWLRRCLQKMHKPIDEVLKDITQQEPTHGREWVPVSKQIHNQYLMPDAILMLFP